MACMTIIPHDIIIDILYLLPTKSLARFRSVSKEWLSLLTDPRFIETHQKMLNRNHFIFESNRGSSFYSVPYNIHHEAVSLTKLDLGFYLYRSIICSVHGLVLASAYKNDNYVPLLVLNPTTKDYVELPISTQLQFYGTKGIGYDSVSHDYKVVVIASFNKYRGNVYVYNLRTKNWKRATYSPYHHNQKSWMPGVFVNGYLHWIFYSHPKPVIVAFSLADEKLSELPPPIMCNEEDIVSDHDTKLVALGEKLAIFNEQKGDLWLMNEYGVQKSWTKIVVHGFKEIPLVSPEVFYDNGKILFLTSDLLRIYDVEERTFCKSIDISYMNIWYFLCSYAESASSHQNSAEPNRNHQIEWKISM